MKSLVVKFERDYQDAWDNFVMQESVNGTFLQTRRFLSYHPADRFLDHSLLVMKGTNIVAVVPAHEVLDTSRKFISHAGSTFGGIVLGKSYQKIADLDAILEQLMMYWKEHQFTDIDLKQTSRLYAKEPTEVIDYYLHYHGFQSSAERGYYVDLQSLQHEKPLEDTFNGSRRRGLRKSDGYEMQCRELISEDGISDFYRVLCNNQEKFHRKPVHTRNELLDFKKNRLKDEVCFYGVFWQDVLIAGSMVFLFGDKQVFHTQYLACDQTQLALYPSERLYYSLIQEAIKKGYKTISFGTATEDRGEVLNRGLAQFKEGFGAKVYVNRNYKTRL